MHDVGSAKLYYEAGSRKIRYFTTPCYEVTLTVHTLAQFSDHGDCTECRLMSYMY